MKMFNLLTAIKLSLAQSLRFGQQPVKSPQPPAVKYRKTTLHRDTNGEREVGRRQRQLARGIIHCN